jgi:uncharacterized coiled-coil protein SlyX
MRAELHRLVAQQASRIADLSRKIVEQDHTIAELNRRVVEYDQRFDEIAAELTRVRAADENGPVARTSKATVKEMAVKPYSVASGRQAVETAASFESPSAPQPIGEISCATGSSRVKKLHKRPIADNASADVTEVKRAKKTALLPHRQFSPRRLRSKSTSVSLLP